jgi:hypothetical protein
MTATAQTAAAGHPRQAGPQRFRNVQQLTLLRRPEACSSDRRAEASPGETPKPGVADLVFCATRAIVDIW